jgi:hypothetical protein
MIAGTLTLTNFNYGVAAGKTERGEPVKFLALKDRASELQILIAFMPEEFDKFVDVLRGTGIVTAREIPK